GLPRKPEEIRHAQSRFASAGCTVKTNAARLEITFPGLALGIFAGELRFTVYRDSSLLRMEAIAKTEEPSVAYKYSAGLSGFRTATMPRVLWRDTGGHSQVQAFGGARNEKAAPVRATNRVLLA